MAQAVGTSFLCRFDLRHCEKARNRKQGSPCQGQISGHHCRQSPVQFAGQNHCRISRTKLDRKDQSRLHLSHLRPQLNRSWQSSRNPGAGEGGSADAEVPGMVEHIPPPSETPIELPPVGIAEPEPEPSRPRLPPSSRQLLKSRNHATSQPPAPHFRRRPLCRDRRQGGLHQTPGATCGEATGQVSSSRLPPTIAEVEPPRAKPTCARSAVAAGSFVR